MRQSIGKRKGGPLLLLVLGLNIDHWLHLSIVFQSPEDSPIESTSNLPKEIIVKLKMY